MDTSPRWPGRLATYSRAVGRLTQIISLREQRGLNVFETDGLIKRFEFTYEMAWKMLMSYEKDNGIQNVMGSRDVVRHAVALGIIDNGDAWMEMIDARNRTSHLYDEDMATDVVDEIVFTYHPLLQELQKKMESIAH